MKIEKDRVVRFHYTVSEVGQAPLESSKEGGEPLAILAGHGNVIPGRTAPYGFVVASGAMPTLRRVPHRRTEYLRERAEEGPWMEPWADRPWHPYNEVFMRQGVRGIAYAPVRDEGSSVRCAGGIWTSLLASS